MWALTRSNLPFLKKVRTPLVLKVLLIFETYHGLHFSIKSVQSFPKEWAPESKTFKFYSFSRERQIFLWWFLHSFFLIKKTQRKLYSLLKYQVTYPQNNVFRCLIKSCWYLICFAKTYFCNGLTGVYSMIDYRPSRRWYDIMFNSTSDHCHCCGCSE